MNEETRKFFTDNVQKNLTRQCFTACKSQRKFFHQCFDQCYNKYIKTINIVNKQVKKIAYEKHSVIGYKAYPENTVEYGYICDTEMFKFFGDAPFALQYQTRG